MLLPLLVEEINANTGHVMMMLLLAANVQV